MAVKLPTVGDRTPAERDVTTHTVSDKSVEIVSDSGEGAQKCGQIFGAVSAKMGNGVWTVEIIPAEVEPPHRFPATEIDELPPLAMDLADRGIRTVLWATGYRPDYSWLNVLVLDRKGRLRHDGGVVEAPGLYVLGLPFLRRRRSSFIDGVGGDAVDEG